MRQDQDSFTHEVKSGLGSQKIFLGTLKQSMIMQEKMADHDSREEMKKKAIWYLDSGCSHHMTGVKSLLTNSITKDGPSVTIGDNSKWLTKGYGTFFLRNVKLFHMFKDLNIIFFPYLNFVIRDFMLSLLLTSVFVKNKSTMQISLIDIRNRNMYVANWSSCDDATC